MTSPTPRAAVMLMAYGAPSTLDEVADVFTHIRGGRRPPEERIEELRERYRKIGGGGSLHRITAGQARALEAFLAADGGEPVRVLHGMRHSRPFIHEAIAALAGAGIGRLVGLALAPHYSTLSVGAYQKALREAAASLGPPPELLLVDSWHDHPLFVASLAETLGVALGRAGREAGGPVHVLFTAHSLPERIVAAGEPYRDQLLETARRVAAATGEPPWSFAFQSASPTGEPWLGPDLFEVIRDLAGRGVRDIVVAPIGFVADHLEILYDIDILARETAAAAGVRLARTESQNERPAFIRLLAALVRERLARAPAVPS